jgi:DNA-directed RNA polymerase subunit RPC12/RpoP
MSEKCIKCDKNLEEKIKHFAVYCNNCWDEGVMFIKIIN